MNTQQSVSYVVAEFVNREQQQREHREKHVKRRPDSDLSFFGHAVSVSSLESEQMVPKSRHTQSETWRPVPMDGLCLPQAPAQLLRSE